MSDTNMAILIFGIYSIIVLITILIWIFIDPTEDLEDICFYWINVAYCTFVDSRIWTI